ncbi:MAG: hypothetical protein GKR91_03655 [Pseudomonadales bacterium]|nr:hypothetical protein [Pseudomonadales bacterium]
MVSIKHRRVNPVPTGRRTFNELHDASTLLDKESVVPATQQFRQRQDSAQNQKQRRGQLIDILV